MPITVLVRSPSGEARTLTFDGTQRVVIGRGAGSDVRLPDASVSHRHATLRANGGDFVIVDEGSTNGTYVGSVRVASRTSRLVRSGDAVRVGRVWLELRAGPDPVTRDVAVATRDLALALVAQALEAVGQDTTPRVRVVEGPNQGEDLALESPEQEYAIGRGAHCDLLLSDQVASREHVRVIRRAGGIFVRDLGGKNGTLLGEHRLPPHEDVLWRPATMVRLGKTVLGVEEPLSAALARIEAAPDDPLDDPPHEPMPEPSDAAVGEEAAPEATPNRAVVATDVDPLAPVARSEAPLVTAASLQAPRKPARRPGPRFAWSAADLAVVVAALLVLALSLAGLAWLLRG